MNRMRFKICPDCGCHLDYGEPCDCRDNPPRITGERPARRLKAEEPPGETNSAAPPYSLAEWKEICAGIRAVE